MTLFKRYFHYVKHLIFLWTVERAGLRKQIQKSKATLARVKKAIDTYNQDPPYGVPVKVDVDWDDLLRADKYRFRIKDLFSRGKKVEAECKELRKQNKKLEAGTARIKSLVHVHNVRPHYGNDFVIDWDSM